MKTQVSKMVISSLILVLGMGASASTRLCYVQDEDSDGVYKGVLAQKTIETNDFQNHLLLQEGDMLYTVVQSELSGKVTVAMFNRMDKATLVLAVSNGVDGITLINEPTRKLIGCSAVTEKK